jgi:hypothetical protein
MPGQIFPNPVAGSSGATTFDTIGSGVNTSAVMIVGGSASLTPAGNGVISANELNSVPVVPVAAILVNSVLASDDFEVTINDPVVRGQILVNGA